MPYRLPTLFKSNAGFAGLGAKIGMIFMLVLLVTLSLVIYAIQTLGKTLVINQSVENMQEKGNRVVNNLDAITDEIATLNTSIAGGSLGYIAQSKTDNGVALNQYITDVYARLDDKKINAFGIHPDYRSRPVRQFNTLGYSGLYWFRPNKDAPYEMLRKEAPNYDLTTDFWFIPPKVLYQRTGYQGCVWTESYVEPINHAPMVTCVSPVVSDHEFLGVTLVDLSLDKIDAFVQQWQKNFSGYMLLIDNNNRILSFPKLTADMRQSLILKNAGVKTYSSYRYDVANITLDDLVENYPQFAAIRQTVADLNTQLINHTRNNLNKQSPRYDNFDVLCQKLTQGTNGLIQPEQAERIVAFTLDNKAANSNTIIDSGSTNTFEKQLFFKHDAILNQPSNVMLFTVPNTHWRLVIAQPQNQTTLAADNLSKSLLTYLIPAILAGIFLILFLVRTVITKRLTQTSRRMAVIEAVIEKQHYHNLSDYNLPTKGRDEISYLNQSINRLLYLIQSNEGALARVNEELEQQVTKRTEKLNHTLQELRTSQVHLVRAEKMATLGQMVAGVAHEVNTPLSYVQNNIELIQILLHDYDELTESLQQFAVASRTGTPSEATMREILQDIADVVARLRPEQVKEELEQMIEDSLFGIEQISELILTLRNFSRIDENKIKRVEITECITTCLIMVKNNLKFIEVSTDFAPTPPIVCSPSQINQVLLNLLNNAHHAVTHKKPATPLPHHTPPPDILHGSHEADKAITTATVSVNNEPKPLGKISIRTYADTDWLYIEITDNGYGMSETTLQNLFEPFFTTKKAGEGTGLGMAISQQIMNQHGGHIDVVSTLNVGTTFTLRLPIQSPLRLQKTL